VVRKLRDFADTSATGRVASFHGKRKVSSSKYRREGGQETLGNRAQMRHDITSCEQMWPMHLEGENNAGGGEEKKLVRLRPGNWSIEPTSLGRLIFTVNGHLLMDTSREFEISPA